MGWSPGSIDDLTPGQIIGGALALFVVLSLSVAGVQVFGDPGPPQSVAVDPADPPAEVAADAFRNASATSHTLTITEETEDDGVDSSWVIRYDPEDKEYARDSYLGAPSEDFSSGFYASENGAWIQLRHHGWTRTVGPTLSPTPFSQSTPLYDPDPLSDGSVSVLAETESQLVLRADLSGIPPWELQEIAPKFPKNTTNTTLVIDKEQRRLDQIIVEVPEIRHSPYEPGSRVRYELSQYGTTDVRRPSGVPSYSIESLWYDVTHGPLFG